MNTTITTTISTSHLALLVELTRNRRETEASLWRALDAGQTVRARQFNDRYQRYTIRMNAVVVQARRDGIDTDYMIFIAQQATRENLMWLDSGDLADSHLMSMIDSMRASA